MRVKITRIDKSLPLPEYHSEGAVGCDLYARVETVIKPKSLEKIPANVIIKSPKGYMFMVASRGSTPFRKGLIPANGIGVGDWDFYGPDDEYQVAVYNITNKKVTVEKGERIAQGIFIKVNRASWVEGEAKGKNRGMFGSTGTHHIKK
jgi:dUTP pyrophosphatase